MQRQRIPLYVYVMKTPKKHPHSRGSCSHANLLLQKEILHKKRVQVPQHCFGTKTKSAVSLFWSTNMVAVTSCENAPSDSLLFVQHQQVSLWCLENFSLVLSSVTSLLPQQMLRSDELSTKRSLEPFRFVTLVSSGFCSRFSIFSFPLYLGINCNRCLLYFRLTCQIKTFQGLCKIV